MKTLKKLFDSNRAWAEEISAREPEFFRELAEARLRLLCELNVCEQVWNVCRTTVVQAAWERGQELSIHGWIYSLDDGLLRDLGLCVTCPEDLADAEEKLATIS